MNAPLSRAAAATVLLAAAATASAQQFERAYGGPNALEQAYAIANTPDGGYVTVGKFRSGDAVGDEILVTRFGPIGNPIWIVVLGGPTDDSTRDDAGYSVVVDPDGSVVVAAEVETNTGGGQTNALVKLDPGGGVVWGFLYNGTPSELEILETPPGPSLIRLDDGGYAFTSSFQGLPQVVRVDADGNIIWQRLYDDTREEPPRRLQFTDLKEDADGTLVICGVMSTDFGGRINLDALLVRLGADGTPLDAVSCGFSPPGPDGANEYAAGLDINRGTRQIAVTGLTDATRALGGPTIGQWLYIAEPSLLPADARLFGAFGVTAAHQVGYGAIRFSPAENELIIAGSVNDPTGSASLTAFDTAAGLRWRRESADLSGFHAVVPTPFTCGYAAAGRTRLFDGLDNTFLVKTISGGVTPCNRDVTPFYVPVPVFPESAPLALLDQPGRNTWNFRAARPFSSIDELCFDPEGCARPCAADITGDGRVDGSDFLEFLSLFFAGDERADFTGDGRVDGADFLEFLSLFFAGC